MKNLLFGIVCFRERFWECESFTSLLASFDNDHADTEINIFIFDNTDLQDWVLTAPEYPPHVKLNYVHYQNNPGIAFAYNYIADIAKGNKFEWLVFLDQDSNLPNKAYKVYEKFASENSQGIAAPKVFANNKLISPSYYRFFRSSLISEPLEDSLKFNNVTCINSGLMVHVSDYFRAGGYSEKLRLDFCDHEFIERASKKIDKLHLLNFRLDQNFSTDTNDLEKALFRYRLFLKDLKAYREIHHNSKLIFFTVDLPHLLRLTAQYKTFAFLKVRSAV